MYSRTPSDDLRNVAVEARRVLEYVSTRFPLSSLAQDRLREVIENIHKAVDRFDNQEITTMHFTISATGTKDEVLQSLESQREDKADYASLKNQVLEHVAGHVQATPEGSTGFSVSVSGSVNFTKPVSDGTEAG